MAVGVAMGVAAFLPCYSVGVAAFLPCYSPVSLVVEGVVGTDPLHEVEGCVHREAALEGEGGVYPAVHRHLATPTKLLLRVVIAMAAIWS